MRLGPALKRGTASESGSPAVILSIQKSPGTNSLALTDSLDALFDQLEQRCLSLFAEGLESVGVGTRIVPVLRASDLAAPLSMAVLAATLASGWPAVRAAALRPSEALRRV